MTDHVQTYKDALEFRDSPRGHFIIAQALYLGIKALYLYPQPYTESSNAMDMKYMLSALYPDMNALFEQTQAPILPPEWMIEKIGGGVN